MSQVLKRELKDILEKNYSWSPWPRVCVLSRPLTEDGALEGLVWGALVPLPLSC